MSNAVISDWPSGSANQGWPQEPSAMLMPGRVEGWPAGTQRAANPAQRLLSQAVAWWDVEQYREGDRFLRNRGTGGELLDLRLGSSIAPNSNDPLFLAPEQQGYVYITATTSNFLTVPHEAGVQVGDDLDLRIDMAADVWNLSGFRNVMGKATSNTAAASSFVIRRPNSSSLELRVSDGTTQSSLFACSLNAAPFTTASRLRLRFRYVRDTGSGQYSLDTYYNDTDFTTPLDTLSSWTQIGSTQTGASPNAMQDVNSAVGLGTWRSTGGDSALEGRYYGAALIVGGVTSFLIDCDAITSGSATSFTASTNQTVNISRSTSGRTAVAVPSKAKRGAPLFLLGTDDFLSIPDENSWQHGLLNFDQSASFTLLAAFRNWHTGGDDTLISKQAGPSTTQYNLNLNYGSAGFIGYTLVDTAATANSVFSALSYTTGTLTLAGLVIDRSGRLRTAYRGGTSASAALTAQDFISRASVRLGSIASGQYYFGGELYAAAIFRRALSPTEITALSNYFTGRIA